MKILVLNWKHLSDPAAGGAEYYVARVASAWSARGHRVTMLVPRPGGRARPGTTDPEGVQIEELGSRTTVFRQARQYLRERGHEFDAVLESVSTRPFFAHELVGDRALVLYHQIADDVWGNEFPFPVSWVGQRVVEPHWLRRIRGARVAANSPSTAADLTARGVVPVGIVPPGADPVGESAAAELGPHPRVIFVGRLVRTKRPLDAIQAFARIRAAFPAATLDIVGDGYLRAELERRRAPGVTVHGFVPAPIKAAFLARANLLLLPGTREGWGIVAIEAGLHGLPVVAYDVPGLRDAVLDRTTGLLTECSPAALGEAAVALMQDPDRWARYAQATQERSRLFTWQRAADDLFDLIPPALRTPSVADAA
ncbi:MAG TPA: glycosyltransferase family 4 protein [Candidatus Dormibacteraeota bacterium]